MVGANVFSALSQAAAATLLITGGAEIWHLAALAAVNGGASAFFFPASAGVIPQTVPAPILQQANALLALAMNSAGAARRARLPAGRAGDRGDCLRRGRRQRDFRPLVEHNRPAGDPAGQALARLLLRRARLPRARANRVAVACPIGVAVTLAVLAVHDVRTLERRHAGA
jgi:hypothetical protein